MNLFFDYREKILAYLRILKKKKKIYLPDKLYNLVVELPPKGNNSDISCNVAMVLSKINNKSPNDLANLLKKEFLLNFKEFKNVSIAGPGFLNINFKIDFWREYLLKIIKSSSKYGASKKKKLNYNIEFVSANPTGPLHVGHCRGAILGDVLSNLLKFNGNSVTKEYYVNDYGNQIKTFALSVYRRILEITEKKPFPTDGDLYPGDYVIDIAKKILKEKKIKKINKKHEKLTKESIKASMGMIRKNLKNLGIRHDNFIYESDLIKKNVIQKTIKKLEKKKYVYKGKLSAPKGDLNNDWTPREQLLFSSTKFGDDVDRSLQKEDQSWTYFAGDIAYHANKIDRKYDKLINILGADHSGYTKRITAAVKAISNNKINLECKVSQLVKLFKKGQPFKMSKRKGDYITADDLMKEVGKDSIRFMMLNRNNEVEIDFDFEKVTEKSKDNPVFYVQYAYARIHSIFRALNLDIKKDVKLGKEIFFLNQYEITILKKISEWPKCVDMSSTRLEPHRIPYYLYDLSTLFHSYWNMGKENKDFRFVIEKRISNKSRLLLIKALAIVIKNGMSILGVTAPKSM